ncbi:hypothetical protein OIDMADRAFT_44672 [Oidiodendron maius Zn]|uniref:Putative transcription factor kapC n=1 Tax=Oidiodendron maius (strain Zn) TaxID=913774 RepID=A0A0C3GKF3_OIDMZ|nr:hypothetical protein OIDMADRAFT_44672 [Oidiodendron maius Zn]
MCKTRKLLPPELDIEGLYGSQGRRRKYNRSDKAIPAHVHSRRRRQNRASQKAFRERKEKRMKETEEKLIGLQGRHNELTQSYERLQVEYSAMKQELETLRCKNESMYPVPSHSLADINESDAMRADHSDPFLFDVSALCYEPKEDM